MSASTIRRTIATLAVGVTLGAVTSGGIGLASLPAGGNAIGQASYQGRLIDLAFGWQGARSCIVFAPTDTRCFATHREADDLLGYWRETDPLYRELSQKPGAEEELRALPACARGWLCLYEDPGGRGRRLIFNDEYWHYLDEWNFDRKTSSWRNNQGAGDPGHLSVYNSVSVYDCSPKSYASQMGIYNDQAYAVWG